MRILVVDDNSENIDIMMIMLKSENYDVISAGNGQEALEKTHSEKFDLIVSDILMPVMDGFQFCRKCKKDTELNKIPFIFYTATYIDEKDEKFALSLGAQKFIRKPQEPEVFLDIIKEVVENSGKENIVPKKYDEQDEKEVLKLYSERLVAKLEKKNLDLENEVALHKITLGKLIESEERFRSLFQNNLSVMLLIDPDNGQIVDANQSAEKYYGWTYQQLTSMRIQDINTLNEETLAEIKKVMLQTQFQFEFQHRLANGSVRNVEVFSSKINIQGKVFLHSIIHDINEQKLAEDALRKSEEKYRSIFENVQDVYYETMYDGTILEVSPSIEIISKGQYHRGDLIGKSMYDFYEDKSTRNDLIAKIQKNTTVNDFEVRLKNRDGLFIWCSISAKICFDPQGLTKKIIGSMHDITERKSAEEALQENERMLSSIFNSVDDVIYHLAVEPDESYRFISVNQAFCNVTGLSEDKIVGKLVNEVVPEHYISMVLEKYRQAIENNTIVRWEETSDYPTGQLIGDVSVAPVFDREGRCTHLVGSVHDITKRKRAEQALRVSEKRLREAQEMAHLGFWYWDVKSGEVEWSEEVYKIFCLNPKEFTPRIDSIQALSPWPEDHQRDKELIEKAIKNHNPGYYEQRFLRPDQSIGHYYSTFQGNYDENGDLTSIVGTVLDITERKISEATLRESEERFRYVFEHSSIGKSLTAPDGSLLRINSAFSDMLGYSMEEMQKLNFADITCPDDLAESMECIRCLLADEQDKFRMEKRYYHKNGKIIWADVSASLFRNGAGIPKYFITNIIDITEKKAQELELIKAKENAEESNKLKTAFLNNISHETRTPMNAIIGFSELLNDPDLEYERQMHYTDIICRSSYQLLSIINDIVNISTIEAGQMIISEKEVNLNQLLNTLFQQYEGESEKKGIELQVKIGLSYMESGVITDETKLLEILSNLINNALKFTKKGYVRYGYIQKTDKIEFFVEDSGIGIPADMHEKIFERFRQADSTISREYGGTGLGLSISQAYVKLLGGEIWLKSELSKGSVFYFNIPYKKIKMAEVEEKKIKNDLELKFNQPKTILIAEDEENNYLLLEEYLIGSNGKLLWAKNGVEAVEKCKHNKSIDIVLMDIKMPRMDGYDATRKIKKINPVLPVIAVTAYTHTEDMGKAIESGCSDYLSKPVKKEELLSIIAKYIKT